MFLRIAVFSSIFLVSGCTYIGPGIYHKVSEGETLWTISRAYNVDVNRITRANSRRLDNPDRIRKGQDIYIPGARFVKHVPKSSLNFKWPVNGKIVYRFGNEGNKRYLGIGISAAEGSPVVASESGKVIFISDDFRSYGKIIIVEHDRDYATVYAHNRVNLVREGEKVAVGQKIAEVGRSGRVSEPCLHFEIRYKEKPRNPLFILQ
ncbi:MAG: peptidoglycan DD-metalloendopeptidase family protein [Elusimicrobia bacterium]|nr:peptidoglycan DD-metalloendopeptidase family protein [Elusimicrobiota bacterium]